MRPAMRESSPRSSWSTRDQFSGLRLLRTSIVGIQSILIHIRSCLSFVTALHILAPRDAADFVGLQIGFERRHCACMRLWLPDSYDHPLSSNFSVPWPGNDPSRSIPSNLGSLGHTNLSLSDCNSSQAESRDSSKLRLVIGCGCRRYKMDWFS
jgi:hypothetical protein